MVGRFMGRVNARPPIESLLCAVKGAGLQWVEIPPGLLSRSNRKPSERRQRQRNRRSLRKASRQAVTRVNAEQAPKALMWEPTRQHNGEGRRPWGRGRQLPRSDTTQGSHRGNGDGMPANGDLTQHGKPQAVGARDSQPDAREGQAGSPGVADRLVVPTRPGNAGGGKEPEFKTSVRRGRRAGRLA
jgi:hypothetical protein